MHLEIHQNKRFLLIRFKRGCKLNFYHTEQFRTELLSRYQPGQAIILNFSNLEYIDSAGLTVLIHVRRKVMESHGSLKITNVGDQIQKLLQITRLHRVFDLYDTVADALESIKNTTTSVSRNNPYSLHLQIKKDDSYYLVRIKQPDSLIKANAAQFRTKSQEYLEKTKTLILNFDNIRNIDSAGIASLIHLKRVAREKKKKIYLVYNNRILTRLFKLYSLDDLFAQFLTDEEAILAVKPVKGRKRVKKPAASRKAQPAQSLSQTEFTDILFLRSIKEEPSG